MKRTIITFIAGLWLMNLAMGQTCTTNPGTLSLYCGNATICVGEGICMELIGYTGEIIRWERKNGSGGWGDVGLGGFNTNTGEAFFTAETVKFRVVVKCTNDPDEQTSNELTVVVNNPTTAASGNGTYGNLRHATARFTLGSNTYTGFLVNHTSSDGRLLFLTTSQADVCHSVNWSNVVFTWLADGATTTSTGATLLATDNRMTLLELIIAPALADLTFLGWDISTTPTSVSCIFESSDNSIKKGIVSASTLSAVSLTTNCNGTFSEGSGSNAVKVSSWSAGEPTASGRGAPLIMNNKKMMGVYIAGNETECNKGPSYFADIAGASSTFLSYLRNGSETNSSTVKIEPCRDYFILTTPVSATPPKPFKVTDYIASTQSIIDGVVVRYEAGNYIDLGNGFVSGTDFVAEIKPCEDDVTIIAAKTENEISHHRGDMHKAVGGNTLIKVYPNPVESISDVYILSSHDIRAATITLYSIEGKRIAGNQLSLIAANTSTSFNIPELTAGLYFIEVSGIDYSSLHKIFVP